MSRQPIAAALIVAALMLSASAQSQNMGLQVDSSGRVGIGTATPAEMLDVRGNLALSGSLLGASSVGGKAAVIQGFGSGGSSAEFSFKYDFANFGNTPSAIQVWNAATGVFKTFVIDHPTDPHRYLVHATPRRARRRGLLPRQCAPRERRAEVTLPAYFEDPPIRPTAPSSLPISTASTGSRSPSRAATRSSTDASSWCRTISCRRRSSTGGQSRSPRRTAPRRHPARPTSRSWLRPLPVRQRALMVALRRCS